MATTACSFDAGPITSHAVSALGVAPSLGSAETFDILAGSTVVNTGPSMIIGNVGVSPGTAIVGFPPGTVTGGALHSADGPAGTAQNDLTAAYNQLAGEPCDHVLTGVDLGGMTLMPAVYCFSTSAQLTGTLVLDGMGDPNAVFVFQIGSTLTTASISAVNMIGSARAGRVFWQVGSSATLGTGTQFSGNILAQVSITCTTGSNIAGRALARTGAVTIDSVSGQNLPTVIITLPDAGVDVVDVQDVQDVQDVADAQDASDVQDAADVEDVRDVQDVLVAEDGIVAPDVSLDVTDAGPDAERGGLSGGAWRCSAAPMSTPKGSTGAAFLILGLGSVIARRRRRRLLVQAGVVALTLPQLANADSLTLNQFHAPWSPEDGLEVSRPVDLGHLRLGANLYLDYAHNPLVYESVLGNSGSQQQSIVRDQLALHVGVSLGLFNRLIVFVGGTGNLVQTGEGRGGYAPADGTRMGDLTLGARVRLIGRPRLGVESYGALALQVGVTLPSANWSASTTQWSGESNVMVTPQILAELGGRHLRVTLDVGARLRTTEALSSISVGPEMTWGLGVGVPLVGKALEVDVETYGATIFSNPFQRQTSPMEAIAGLRWHGESGWTAGLGAGPGLVRGYGTPDVRAIATIGWAMPEAHPRAADTRYDEEAASPPQPRDSDGDGVLDAVDQCPHTPGPADNHGCPRFVRLLPTEVTPAEIVILNRIEFDTDEAGTTRTVDSPILHEVLAVLMANPQLRRVSIDGHADERGTEAHNVPLSQRRAEAVMHWLVEHGIDANRLEAHGRGAYEPFVRGTTPAEEQTNRNVQFFILQPPATVPAR